MFKKTKVNLNWFLLIAFCFLFVGLQAAWLENLPSQITQPDGTTIDVLLTGDEFHNWVHNEDGFTIIQDDVTGYWCWARAENGNLISTGYPVHLNNPISLGLSPKENISVESYLEKRADWDNEFHSRDAVRAPTKGSVVSLFVYIRFSDQSEFPYEVSHFDDMLNALGHGVNSMQQYFLDASHGQLNVYSHIFPVAPGSMVVSYQSPQPRSYYLPYNSTTNPNGWQGSNNGAERRQREHALLRDAIAYIHNQIPSDINLDADDDGRVDHVNFIIRGTPGAWSTLLWPHAWSLSTFDVRIHGKRVWAYNFNMETSTNSSGVGVLSHEFAHSLGLPDFYRYNTSGYHPTGVWDLMATDRNPPQSITAHAQAKYLQWIPPIPVITESGTYTLNPLTFHNENVAFRINSPYTSSEYFVVEYRNNEMGLIDSTLPGSGLLVYRVNPSLRGNSDGDILGDEIYLYRPGGSLANNGQMNSAFFNANVNRVAINDLTDPNSFLQNGQPGGLFISHIGTPDETISFNVLIGGANPEDFNESFENQVFSDYDWILEDENSWYITNEHASHGDYSATSPLLGNGESSRLETNLIVDSGFIQFFVKTSILENGGSIRFLIDNQEIRSWSGETDWTHFSTPILSGQHNFAWIFQRTNSGSGETSKVWIDQIGFPEIIGHVLYPPTNLDASVDERDILFSWNEPFKSNIPDHPHFLGYNLYQNQILLNDTPILETTYTHFNSTGGPMQHWVTAVYETSESPISNTISVPMPFMTPVNLIARIEGAGVRLDWEFPVEAPTLRGFRVHRNGQIITMPILAADVFTFHDVGIEVSGLYTYHISAMFTSPTGFSAPSNEVEIDFVVDIEDDNSPVYMTQLIGNFPNPFNPETTISFSLANESHVKLEIFNIRGALVKTLLNESINEGVHTRVWNGLDTHGNTVASGIYFYRLSTDSFQSARRMILIK